MYFFPAAHTTGDRSRKGERAFPELWWGRQRLCETGLDC
jgi:hypothetical protein